MAKINLTDVSSGYLSFSKMNENNAAIEAAFDLCVFRNGTSPNAMAAELDMNGYNINNLPDATQNQQPITLAQAASIAGVTNPLTQDTVAAVLYPETSDETAAGVTIVNYEYPERNVLRYGTNTNEGTTDMATALQAAIDVCEINNDGGEVFIPKGVYYFGTALTIEKNGITLVGEGRGGAANSNNQGTVLKTDVASGAAITFGVTTASRWNNGMRDIKVDITSAGSGVIAVKGISLKNARFDNVRLTTNEATNQNHVGFRFDGENAYCAWMLFTGCFVRGAFLKGVEFLSSDPAATGNVVSNGCNSNVWIGGGVFSTLDTTATTGSIGVHIQEGRDNFFYGIDAVDWETYFEVDASANRNQFHVRCESANIGNLDYYFDCSGDNNRYVCENHDATYVNDAGSSNEIHIQGDVLGSRAIGRNETLTTTKAVAATENGKTFYLNAAGGFTVTLPAPFAGAKYKFIVKTNPTTAYIVQTNGQDNILYGHLIDIVGEMVSVNGNDTITFVASTSLKGDCLEVESDGVDWFIFARSRADGGITATTVT